MASQSLITFLSCLQLAPRSSSECLPRPSSSLSIRRKRHESAMSIVMGCPQTLLSYDRGKEEGYNERSRAVPCRGFPKAIAIRSAANERRAIPAVIILYPTGENRHKTVFASIAPSESTISSIESIPSALTHSAEKARFHRAAVSHTKTPSTNHSCSDFAQVRPACHWFRL